MGNILEFTLKLKDQLTGGLAGVSSNVNRQFDNMARATRPVMRSLGDMRSQMDALNRTIVLSVDDKQVREAAAELKRLKGQEFLFNQRYGLGGASTPSGGGLMGMASLASRIPQILAASAAFSYGSDAFGEAIDLSRKKKAIDFGTGGQGPAAIAQIDAITEKLGINFKSSVSGFKTLSGSLRGMQLEKQMDLFKGVSAGVAAMGLSGEDAQGVYLALGQMASKGTVSAEELRGQIGERIPGAFSIAAKAMGVSEAALGKMMQKGEIASRDFLPRFAMQMEKTFGAAAMGNASGPSAQMERLANAMYKLQVVVGEQLIPVLIPFMEKYLIPATNWLNKQGDAIGRMITWLIRLQSMGTYLISSAIDSNKMHAEIANGAGRGTQTVIEAIKKGVSDSSMYKFFEMAGKAHGVAYSNSLVSGIQRVAQWADNFYNTTFFTGKLGEVMASKHAGATVTAKSNSYAMTGAPGDASKETAKAAVKDKVDSITGGGARNVYITLGKFQDQLNIHTTTFKEGVNEMEAMIENSLLRILNSANAISH